MSMTSQGLMGSVLAVDIVAWSLEFDENQYRMVERMYDLLDKSLSDSGVTPAAMLPTGDGAILIFEKAAADDPINVARCFHERLHDSPWDVPVRMGIHTGSMQRFEHETRGTRYVGGAINLAVRVLDLGDPGHILLTRSAYASISGRRGYAESVSELPRNPVRVKHGVEIDVFNYATSEVGNRSVPAQLRGHLPDGSPSEQFGWGHLFESFVDAGLYLENEREIARDEIVKAIKQERLIPSRYHYATDMGAGRWIELTEDPEYRHHVRTKQYWAGQGGREMSRRIREQVGLGTKPKAFDFVSLGPGEGAKDAWLVRHWVAEGADLFYLPYDVSLPLVWRSIKEVRTRSRQLHAGSLHVKAVLADFRHFKSIAEVLSHRDAPNVVGLLGTLGNLENEKELLSDLAQQMGEADLLLLEVRLVSQDGLDGLKSSKSYRHDFGPLEYYLGLNYDACAAGIEGYETTDRSTIPETITWSVEYKGPTGLDFEHKPVRLQYIHMYRREPFVEALKECGFELVGDPVDKVTFMECLVRKAGEIVHVASVRGGN
jgi:Histidine-specific methyltransferase, SAM-dependent